MVIHGDAQDRAAQEVSVQRESHCPAHGHHGRPQREPARENELHDGDAKYPGHRLDIPSREEHV